MKDKFTELGCEFFNESFCEELVEEEGYEIFDIEREHYEEEE